MRKEVRRTAVVCLVWVFVLPILHALSAEIYQWRDKDGKIYFSDTPPPGVDVEIKRFKEDSTDRQKTKDDTSGAKSYGSTERRSYGSIDVVMYMTPRCGYCRKAREYILSLGVNLVEYNVESDRNRWEEMLRKSGGSRGVPLIDVEGIIIKGYSSSAIKAAVERKRSQ